MTTQTRSCLGGEGLETESARPYTKEMFVALLGTVRIAESVEKSVVRFPEMVGIPLGSRN